ncbi:hypothetical protein T439DRAFT_380412 [Meredithblackwellia eburnea MCA 4105]
MTLNPAAAPWNPSTPVATGRHFPVKLSNDIWIEIFVDHGLSYFDLKRMVRVCRTFKMIIQSTSALQARLFGGVPTEFPVIGAQVLLHPTLIQAQTFIEKRIGGYRISPGPRRNPNWPVLYEHNRDVHDRNGTSKKSKKNLKKSKFTRYQDQTFAIYKLACASEFATSPPLTHLGILGIGKWGTVYNPSGVTVMNVLRQIETFWNEQMTWESGDGSRDGCSYYERLLGSSLNPKMIWNGWEGPMVGRDGHMVIKAKEFSRF